MSPAAALLIPPELPVGGIATFLLAPVQLGMRRALRNLLRAGLLGVHLQRRTR